MDEMQSFQQTKGLQTVIFHINNRPFCIELSFIREVVTLSGLKSIPNATPHVAGVINIRGEVIPVFNIESILLGPSNQAASTIPYKQKILLINFGTTNAGLIVHSVSRVASLSLDGNDDEKASKQGYQNQFLKTVLKSDDEELIPLVDIPKLMARLERINSSIQATAQKY